MVYLQRGTDCLTSFLPSPLRLNGPLRAGAQYPKPGAEAPELQLGGQAGCLWPRLSDDTRWVASKSAQWQQWQQWSARLDALFA